MHNKNKKCFFTNKTDIKNWLNKFNIKNYSINEDLTVDTNSFIYLTDKSLEYLPIRFKNVEGGFYIAKNLLTSLSGCPQYVGGSFDCTNNSLKTLNDGPQIVKGSFFCSKNKLTGLRYSPEFVGQDFVCHSNKIRDLTYLPKTITGTVGCRDNKFRDLGIIENNIFKEIIIGNLNQNDYNLNINYKYKSKFLKFLEDLNFKNDEFIVISLEKLKIYFEKKKLENNIINKNCDKKLKIKNIRVSLL